MNKASTIIIGGGAAGCALAARLGKSATLIEWQSRLGRKLAATGNGQGNISNSDMCAAHFHTADFEKHGSLIADIINCDVTAIFDGIFVTDSRGRIYPSGRQASALTDDLRRKISINNVQVIADKAISITKNGDGFTVTTECGKKLRALNVVIATGGKAQSGFGSDGSGYALALMLGHTVTPLSPSLVQMKATCPLLKTLKGIRCDCTLTIENTNGGKAVDGEIIFTDYGISGSAVIYLSPQLRGEAKVRADLLPTVDLATLSLDIQRKIDNKYSEDELLDLTMNRRLARAVIAATNAVNAKSTAIEHISIAERIAYTAKNFPITVTGTLGFDSAQVTRGGIPLSEVTDNLESKKVSGLYFAGEVLDVDGDCGGYNLHWAISSAERVYAAIAGKSK